MKKILIPFSIFTAHSCLVATGVYYLFSELRAENIADLATVFTDSAVAFYNPFMQVSLLFYILGSSLIGISFIVAICLRNSPFIDAAIKDRRFIYLFIFSFFVPIILCFVKTWAIIFIYFLFLVFFVLILKCHGNFKATVVKLYKTNMIPKIILFASILFIGVYFFHFIFSTPNIMNSFFRIPEMYNIGKVSEKTIINNSVDANGKERGKNSAEKSDAYISTTTLINNLNLIYNYEYVDIFNYKEWKSNSACMVVAENNVRLSDFVSEYRQKIVRPAPNSWYSPDKHYNFPPLLHYSEDRLCIIPSVGSFDYINISNTYIRKKLTELGIDTGPLLDNYIQQELRQNGMDFAKLWSDQKKAPIAQDFKDAATRASFLENSIWERTHLANQRSDLRHHIYYLFPSYEYLMGKPLNQIVVQYGVGMTLFFSAVGKVTQFFGLEPTYAGALCFMKAFIYIAFAVFVFCSSIIFKDIRLTSLAALVFILCQLRLGYYVHALVAGNTELRLLFDLPAIYFLFRYSQGQSDRSLGWLLVFMLLALFNNFEFGLYLAVSILAALFIRRLLEQDKKPNTFYFIVAFFVISLFYYIYTIPHTGIGSYFVLGFFSEKIESMTVGYLFGLLTVYIFMFLHMLKNSSRFSYPFLASVFYSQTLLCYYIWCGIDNHFDIVFARLALPLLLYFAFIFKEKIDSEFKRNILYYAVAAIIVMNAYASLKEYESVKGSFNNTFKYHKIYTWDKYGTNINSTMNPIFFESAVTMIKKYLPAEKEMYMISQYDFWLTYLAKKYSGMPHFELSSNLPSPESIELAIDRIHSAKPEYIFVDSDINTPYELSIIGPEIGIQQYADGRWHILALNNLRDVYKRVIDDYALIERGRLISVYKRKEAPVAISALPRISK